MGKGINRAEEFIKTGSYKTYYESVRKSFYCIFISHISVDKYQAKKIGDYLINAGFDIYLDINDGRLQTAVNNNDPLVITECIQKGIDASSHILCLITDSTNRSWWVPFEIGYGKKGLKQIASIIFKDVDYLPEYLKVSQILRGIKSLNEYLKRIKPSLSKISGVITEDKIVEYTVSQHPLENFIEWSK